jgi:hypothetical protein
MRRIMTSDNPTHHDQSSLRKVLLVSFLLGLWLLGAISGMLFFNLLNFISFRSKEHILILVLLIVGSIVLMGVSYLFFPRGQSSNQDRSHGAAAPR